MYYLKEHSVILLIYGISLVRAFFRFTNEDFLIEKEKSVYVDISMLQRNPTHWIEQPVDHFSFSDKRTWKNKYYKVMNSWKPEGPILLYLNGEGPLTLSKLEKRYLRNYGGDSQSLLNQIAEETGAAIFMLEHRYYGKSKPFYTLTTENLSFLTSRQALADAAHLLIKLKETPEFKNSKVIVVGGSYAGNLAAWMKLMYPWLVDAVVSSSAPVLAKLDFYEYFEKVTKTFKTYGSQECVREITERFNTFHALLQSSEGIKKFKAENHICEHVDMTVPENQQLFFVNITSLFGVVAQYGTPDFISSFCMNLNLSKPDDQFPISWNEDNDCADFDFDNWIHGIKSSDDSQEPWSYQTCTEFGFFPTCFSNKQMFGNSIPVNFYVKKCKLLFGEEFNETKIDQGVKKTNSFYGGLTPNVTNVVFVNGDMDPWHSLGILHDLSPDAPAIYINGSSHGRDLSPSDPSDTENIKQAREIIKMLVKKWIGQA